MTYLFICLQSFCPLSAPTNSFLQSWIEIFRLSHPKSRSPPIVGYVLFFWGAMVHLFICLQSFCLLSTPSDLFCIDTSRFFGFSTSTLAHHVLLGKSFSFGAL